MKSFRELVEHLNLSSNVEDKIINMYNNNATIEEIKQTLNCSTGKIYRTLEEQGVSCNRLKKNHDMIHYYHDVWQLPTEQIASFTSYTPRWIRNVLKRERNGSS